MRRDEDKLQAEVVLWFNHQYPQYRRMLFWVPNELINSCSMARKATCKALGLTSGVSDLILLAKGQTVLIELKTRAGKQSDAQKDFQEKAQSLGHPYHLVRSLEDFQELCKKYLS